MPSVFAPTVRLPKKIVLTASARRASSLSASQAASASSLSGYVTLHPVYPSARSRAIAADTFAARDANRNVTSVDLGLFEKAAMQTRAAAVLDRVADQRELHTRRPGSINRSKKRKIRVTAKSLRSIGSVRIV